MARTAIKDQDKGYKELVKRVYGLGKPKITVGITAASGAEAHEVANPDVESAAMTVLEVAMIQEFGAGNIPARPFIRGWFDENRDRALADIRKMLELVIAGKVDKDKALELLGLKFVGEIQARIARGIAPANAQSTIDKKGSATPLIATGQLRSAVTFKVET